MRFLFVEAGNFHRKPAPSNELEVSAIPYTKHLVPSITEWLLTGLPFLFGYSCQFYLDTLAKCNQGKKEDLPLLNAAELSSIPNTEHIPLQFLFTLTFFLCQNSS